MYIIYIHIYTVCVYVYIYTHGVYIYMYIYTRSVYIYTYVYVCMCQTNTISKYIPLIKNVMEHPPFIVDYCPCYKPPFRLGISDCHV